MIYHPLFIVACIFLSFLCISAEETEFFGYGIKPACIERIASCYSFYSQIAALDRTEPSYRIDPVNGASRIKPAARRLDLRQCDPVKLYQSYKKIFHPNIVLGVPLRQTENSSPVPSGACAFLLAFAACSKQHRFKLQTHCTEYLC